MPLKIIKVEAVSIRENEEIEELEMHINKKIKEAELDEEGFVSEVHFIKESEYSFPGAWLVYAKNIK